MSTQHTDRTVPPALEWLIDALRARVTTLEIELAHWEHTSTARVRGADAFPQAHGTRRCERRAAGVVGGADE